MNDETLLELVLARVRRIPPGQVMSYGQVGDEVGCTARQAGWAMNQAWDGSGVPWQRVVGGDGHLRTAKRSPLLAQRQRELLEAEGVTFRPSGGVDMAKHRALGPPKSGQHQSDQHQSDQQELGESPWL